MQQLFDIPGRTSVRLYDTINKALATKCQSSGSIGYKRTAVRQSLPKMIKAPPNIPYGYIQSSKTQINSIVFSIEQAYRTQAMAKLQDNLSQLNNYNGGH